MGKERAETGTPHLQGYLELGRSRRLGGVKQLLGSDRFHLEKARGTGLEASQYCKKEGDYFEVGTLGPGQGARTDLDEVKSMLDAGAPLGQVAEQHFSTFIRYHKGFALYRSLVVSSRGWRTQCVWYWGSTGTGKTRLAYSEASRLGNEDVWLSSDPTLRWFDGYTGQKTVILDDFGEGVPITLLLRLLDRYPFKVPVKGGFSEWIPRIVWITSNYSPSKFYGHMDEHYRALERRIDEIRYFE